MSHLSPNELEPLVQESEEAADAGRAAVASGEVAPASRPAQEPPNAKRAKCAFAAVAFQAGRQRFAQGGNILRGAALFRAARQRFTGRGSAFRGSAAF